MNTQLQIFYNRNFKLYHCPRIGKKCFSNKWIIIDKNKSKLELTYNPKGWDGALSHICLGFIFCAIYIKLPFRIKYFTPNNHKQSKTSMYIYMDNFYWIWRGEKLNSHRLPFRSWIFKHRLFLTNNLTWEINDDNKLLIEKSFTNITKNGVKQKTVATISGDKREWSLFWFPFKTKTSIDLTISFKNGLGSKASTWKGGIYGCSFPMRKNELIEEAWERFKKDKTFD